MLLELKRNLAGLAQCLPYLFGSASCPACETSWPRMAALVDYAA